MNNKINIGSIVYRKDLPPQIQYTNFFVYHIEKTNTETFALLIWRDMDVPLPIWCNVKNIVLVPKYDITIDFDNLEHAYKEIEYCNPQLGIIEDGKKFIEEEVERFRKSKNV